MIASLLYGVDARDPVTLTTVAAVLAVVSLAACWLPARRAAHLDPVVVLRGD
jgi:ABC-type lipoprotein release transport system permease subunit